MKDDSLVGRQLGSYHILDLLGVGGMGEVYRAHDTRLGRDVAIKILPRALAADPDRLARFQREARTLAALNHPHIGAIYGLEDASGVPALVLELIAGETLADRLCRGPLPIAECLSLARQIAEALEAAHERHIVHRDLKPANIKVTPDGVVKILDFGLAKALAGDAAPFDSSESPTITAAGTHDGVILGTAAYMSPEQARGRPVDRRADLWAFGVVLYEMLTGRRAFEGESVSDTLSHVLTKEPDWSALPADTPASIRTLLRRCLAKDRKQRLDSATVARLDLDDASESPQTEARASGVTRARRVLPWSLFATATLAAIWAIWPRTEPPLAGDVIYADIGLPGEVEPMVVTSSSAALAPDGRSVAVVGVKDGVRRVFVRRINGPEFVEVPGSAGANSVAFSPDRRNVAFISANATLTIASLVDQQRRDVASGVDLTLGLAWSEVGVVFTRSGALWIVSPEGGTPRALTTLDHTRREVINDHPFVTPNGRFVVFVSQTDKPDEERIEAVAIEGGARHVVVERAMTPMWSPSGHLLFQRDGAVLAAAFDQRSATLSGEAIPVLPRGTIESSAYGELGVWMSPAGTLLYMPNGFFDQRIVSVARDGAALALNLPAGRYANPRISPDGRRLLVESGRSVLQALDLTRGTQARLTAAVLGTLLPTWNADGALVVYRRFTLPFWVAANGSGTGGVLPKSTINDFPSSAGPDPDSVLVARVRPDTSADVFLMSISGAFEPKPLVATPAYDGGPQLSPDGRWLLYQSSTSGRSEIYVQRYPTLDRPWQVSEDGGLQPRWRADGREIFYRDGRHFLGVTMNASGGEPAFGRPMPLFADEYDFGHGASIANYDVTRDGRFILVRRGANSGRLRAITNWTGELHQILASGGVH